MEWTCCDASSRAANMNSIISRFSIATIPWLEVKLKINIIWELERKQAWDQTSRFIWQEYVRWMSLPHYCTWIRLHNMVWFMERTRVFRIRNRRKLNAQCYIMYETSSCLFKSNYYAKLLKLHKSNGGTACAQNLPSLNGTYIFLTSHQSMAIQ